VARSIQTLQRPRQRSRVAQHLALHGHLVGGFIYQIAALPVIPSRAFIGLPTLFHRDRPTFFHVTPETNRDVEQAKTGRRHGA
jgi:hypothetical protein